MTDLRTAAQQALEALEAMTKHFGFARLGSSSLADTMKRGDAHVAMNNLRAALAEPVQEPAFHGFMSADGTRVDLCFTPSAPRADGTYATAYYTAPPQRPAKPQGCSHCNHPLYAAIKCRVCGRVTEPVQEPDDKAASIRWQLCLLAQTEESSDDVRNQIGRGVWLIDRLCAALAEPVQDHFPDATKMVQEPVAYSVGRTLYWHEGKGVNDVQLYLAPPQRPAKPQGCDHCNHPLYAATKCRVCGRVTEPTTEDSSAVEPVQEPFALQCPTPKACKAHCCSGNCIPRSMA